MYEMQAKNLNFKLTRYRYPKSVTVNNGTVTCNYCDNFSMKEIEPSADVTNRWQVMTTHQTHCKNGNISNHEIRHFFNLKKAKFVQCIGCVHCNQVLANETQKTWNNKQRRNTVVSVHQKYCLENPNRDVSLDKCPICNDEIHKGKNWINLKAKFDRHFKGHRKKA